MASLPARGLADAPRVLGDRGGKSNRNVMPGDLLQSAADDGKSFRTYYVGQPVFVAGTWYEVTSSADGSNVAAKPVKLDAGKLRINAARCPYYPPAYYCGPPIALGFGHHR